MPLDTRRLVALPSAPGLLLGAFLFALSLSPSLVPRPFLLQGLVSALSFTLGYATGTTLRWLWEYLELPLPGTRTDRLLKLVAGGVTLVVAAIFLWQASAWQNELRALMGLSEEARVRHFSVGFVTLALFSVLLVVARTFREVARTLSHRLQAELPRRVALVLGVVLAASLFWTVAEGVLFSGALRMADASYRQLDGLVTVDAEPPASTLRSGSPASRSPWESLGRQGRSFVTGGVDTETLRRLVPAPRPGVPAEEDEPFAPEPDLADPDVAVPPAHAADPMEPIRVYVGLRGGETPEERARLAMEELERTGAFQRDLLLLVTPTGTGWVDPAAMVPIEVLAAGNVATVTVQYSYLSSPLALLAEPAYGAETARALFLEVYGHWTSLPPDARPALYLHGVSLGSLNSSLSFDFEDILADPPQGALWSGPPFRSEAWARATRERHPDSPAWRPIYRDGRVVRFMNQDGGLETPEGPWGPLRIAYLQHASDPITFFGVDAFWREPDWMQAPRGPDVSPRLRWYPVVTMLQLAADMLVGDAPPGFGHTFSAVHYLEAWAALLGSDWLEARGWDAEALNRLRDHLRAEEAASVDEG